MKVMNLASDQARNLYHPYANFCCTTYLCLSLPEILLEWKGTPILKSHSLARGREQLVFTEVTVLLTVLGCYSICILLEEVERKLHIQHASNPGTYCQ